MLGFEYGYALHCGRDLVVWEAQFGDFVNNAQAIIDQFIASGERKWGYANGLVIFLPHGNEGGGPEHSSGYLGRFLQLCGDDNLRVAVPSTAAQLYHLLRRQALTDRRKPLIVMTPKMGLHNNAASFSRLQELANGGVPAADRRARAVDAQAVTRADRHERQVVLRPAGLAIAAGAMRCRDSPPRRAVSVPRGSARAGACAAFRGCARSSGRRRKRAITAHGICCATTLEAVLPAGVTLLCSARPAAAPSAVCDPKQHAAEQRQVALAGLSVAARACR